MFEYPTNLKDADMTGVDSVKVKEDLTDSEMIEACKIACLDDFIENLKDKLAENRHFFLVKKRGKLYNK